MELLKLPFGKSQFMYSKEKSKKNLGFKTWIVSILCRDGAKNKYANSRNFDLWIPVTIDLFLSMGPAYFIAAMSGHRNTNRSEWRGELLVPLERRSCTGGSLARRVGF
ncbi:unnamed protein product [Brugia pahangi]|uniref:DUF805 domain-containing protein n=1 Tax=Brugia pahangi TaxID=6280 RepID=A0A0N4TQ98_BRUPA|nr:unnamed protein product [Brugia pahangi]